MIKDTWLKPVAWWVLLAAPMTAVLLIGYVLVQQDYRESLNDPQVQMAEDAALSLAGGSVPAHVMPLIAGQAAAQAPSVDIAISLMPWIAVYDANGQLLESSGQLDNAPPQLPAGVFDTSAWIAHPGGLFFNQSPVAQNRFTWQPRSGVRVAVVLTQTSDKKYFVAAGRNMREVEQRIEHEGEIAFVGWFATLGLTLVMCFIVWGVLRPRA